MKSLPDKRSTPASHVVSFRLSPDLFRELEGVSQRMQGGTPAELAREMVCAFLQACGNPGELALSLSVGQLVRKASELKSEVNRLAVILDDKVAGISVSTFATDHVTNPLLKSEN